PRGRDRAFHAGRFASGRGAGSVDFGPRRRDPFRSIARPAVPRIPTVDVGHGQRQHPLADRADHQWRSAGTRPRYQLAIARRIELAGEVDFTVAQERSNDGERFGESRHTPVEGKAVGAIFGFVPARAQPENQASSTDLIDGSGHFGKHRRVVKAGASNEWPDRNAAGRSGDAGQRRPRLPRPSGAIDLVAIQKMVAYPHRVETNLLAEAGHGDDFRPADFRSEERRVGKEWRRGWATV